MKLSMVAKIVAMIATQIPLPEERNDFVPGLIVAFKFQHQFTASLRLNSVPAWGT